MGGGPGLSLVDALRLPVRAGVAAALAYAVAALVALSAPIYALVSAVVVTDLDAEQTRKLALPRMLGTFMGAGVGSVSALLVRATPLTVAIGVLVPMFLCALVRVPAAAKVAGYVSAIIMVGFAQDPWAHARDRMLETLIGIAAATLVSLVPMLIPKRKDPDSAP